MKKVSVLFVCMGNICRSPTAEGVFKQIVEDEGMSDFILSDSAGTHSYHIGNPPDPRAQDVASENGFDLSMLKSRQIVKNDFYDFDFIIAMDERNLAELAEIKPDDATGKLHLMMKFAKNHEEKVVPDPYYGGIRGFERVFDMVEDASHGLFGEIKKVL